MIQPYEDLAKFDYNLDMKVKIFKIFFYIFWLHVGTYCKNFGNPLYMLKSKFQEKNCKILPETKSLILMQNTNFRTTNTIGMA
jgi:hypothetical protein